MAGDRSETMGGDDCLIIPVNVWKCSRCGELWTGTKEEALEK